MIRRDSKTAALTWNLITQFAAVVRDLNGLKIPFWVLISGGKTEMESSVVGGEVTDSTPFFC